jgi:nicotinamide phosphoribosyltransferase
MNPFLATDGYKTGHHNMYPKGTKLVYSNFTPRSNKHAPAGCDKVVVFGTQMSMVLIYQMFADNFFAKPKEEVCQQIKEEYSMYLGTDYDVSHIEALWELGYLPIKVKALPEGTLAPMGVPVLTIYNTLPQFFWLTNFLETLLSTLLWKPMTAATIARQYKKNLIKWALGTDKDNVGFVDFQGHNFSMRGMDGVSSAMNASLGHATSFLGDDTLATIHGARKFYHAKGPVVHSVNATEHSVMCAGKKDDELGTFRYLMEQFPKGILSIVSDTWNLWTVLTKYLPILKEEILARDGKIVIRPDSGDPADIICGLNPEFNKPEWGNSEKDKGVIELLWNIFGGTVNEQGYKVLDPHIGAIYGDSITIDRAEDICARLAAKGFASTNIVLGIGSFTYQFNTRDTFGFAMKATYVEIKGQCTCSETSAINCGSKCQKVEGREIFKNPITDDGTKKSAKGLLRVSYDQNKRLQLEDQVDWTMESQGELQTIFEDGAFINVTTFEEIRDRIKQSL